MIILFIVGLLLGAVSVIFALQNIAVITVTFFSWQLTGSLALILLLAIASGVCITTFLLLPEFISNYFKYRALIKENEKVREELRKQKELTVFAKNTPPPEEKIIDTKEAALLERTSLNY